MMNSVELAHRSHLGPGMAGLDVEVILTATTRQADVGKQVADEMLKKAPVDFVAGIIWSNVMLAVAPRHRRGAKFHGSARTPRRTEARGKDVQRAVLHHFLAERRYARGDGQGDAGPGHHRRICHGAELRRRQGHGERIQCAPTKGRIVDEVYTRLRADRLPGGALPVALEESQAVFVLLSGGMGISFLRQYSEAGLRGQFPLYSVYTVRRDFDPGDQSTRRSASTRRATGARI